MASPLENCSVFQQIAGWVLTKGNFGFEYHVLGSSVLTNRLGKFSSTFSEHLPVSNHAQDIMTTFDEGGTLHFGRNLQVGREPAFWEEIIFFKLII